MWDCVERVAVQGLAALPLVRRLQPSAIIEQQSLRAPGLPCLPAPAGDSDWWGKHRITIGEKAPDDLKLAYSEALASSKFCFVLPGDGFSARLEDAVLHG